MLRKYIDKLCYEVIFNETHVHIWTDRFVDGMLLFFPQAIKNISCFYNSVYTIDKGK